MSRTVKSAVAWLSVANTLFVVPWNNLITDYFVPSPDFPSATPIYGSLEAANSDYFALVFCVFALGFMLFLGEQCLLRLPSRFRDAAHAFYCLSAVALAIQVVRPLVGIGFSPRGFSGGHGWWSTCLWILYVSLHLTLVASFVLWMKQPQRAIRIFHASFIVVISLLIFRVGSLGKRILEESQARPAQMTLPKRQKGSPRVVLVFLDRWDYSMTYLKRPPGLKLPAMDALAKSSVFLENAFPPATYTSPSLISILLEKPLQSHLRWTRAGTFKYLLKDETSPREMNPSDSLFSKLAHAGYSSSIIGFYLPYCRLFQPFVSECIRFPHLDQKVRRSTGDFSRNVLQSFSTLISLPSTDREYAPSNAQELLNESIRIVKEAKEDFTYIHFPFPHPPWVYDRSRDSFVPVGTPGIGYLDSLALSDKALSRVVQAIEESGESENTTLIVSSDHSNYDHFDFGNTLDERVPLMIRFPKSVKPLRVKETYNTFHLGRLVTSVLKSGVPKDETISTWLATHLTKGEYPLH